MTLDEFLKTRGSRAMLADKMGVSRQAVSEWIVEKKCPHGRNVIKVSDACNELGVKTTPAEVLAWFLANQDKESV